MIHETVEITFEVLGWTGSILYLISYLLLAVNLIDKGKLYYYFNIAAAVLVALISLEKTTYQAVVINLLWGLISFNSLYKFYKIKLAIKPFLFRFTNIILFIAFSIIIIFHIELGIKLYGWLSVIFFVVSFFLFSTNFITEKEFHIWNFIAALLIIPQLYIDNNWPVIVLEIFWAAFAVWGFFNEDEKFIPE